jgi:hypothetical protein
MEYYRRTQAGLATEPFVFPIYDFRQMGEHLAELGLVRFGTIGSATLRATRARVMVDTILATLKAEPTKWLDEPFLTWWGEAVGR